MFHFLKVIFLFNFIFSQGVLSSSLIGCADPEAYTCSGSLNGDYNTQIGAVQYDYSCSSCDNGEVCDGYYGSSEGCYYYQAPSASEVSFTIDSESISLDWSAFSPPELSSIVNYRVSRCADQSCIQLDGGATENTNIIDEFSYNDFAYVYYVVSVNYENNPYWGWANGEQVYAIAGSADPEAYT